MTRLKTVLRAICDRALAQLLPEWQVFVRFPNGRGRYFVVTQKIQAVLIALLVLVAGWTGATNILLLRQPVEISIREQQLDQEIANLKRAQSQLIATGGLVKDLANEVNDVHANLSVLADTHTFLAQDQDQKGQIKALAQLKSDFQGLMQSGRQDEPVAVEGVRDDLRKLRLSLDHLKETYIKALTRTSALTDHQTDQIEQSLQHVGIKAEEQIRHKSETRGMGGPFIPLETRTPSDEEANKEMAGLLSSLDHWNRVKDVASTMPLAEPLHEEWEMNSPFGARFDPLNESAGMHEGMDLGAPMGTPIFATGTGHVKMAGPYDRYGLTVDVDHGNGYVTRYAHLSQIKVKPGQKVTRDTVIGLLGNTGRTTGAHLHYEVRIDDVPRNPISYIMAGRDASKTR
jgi:murein DD-endopeptidase MepM/ murein hydrolase activator NlpD